MKKKITLLAIIVFVVLLATNVFAVSISSKNVSMELVENNVCTIDITDYAKFEKKIIDYDLEKKEITIGLKVVNNATTPLDEPSEIVLLMDNSLSMRETISTGGSRMQAISNSAKTLATELLKYPNVKISVVSFSTVNNDGKNPGDADYIEEGTMADAKLRTVLTQDSATIMSAIEAVANDATGVRTDIDAGLTLASQQFSGTIENKYIILLTDGVPNISLGSNRILYSGETATNTKAKLVSLDNAGINILSMMTGVTEDVNSQTGDTYKELAEEVFGTPTNPTVGKFYYITDNEIEETISNTILTQLKAPEDQVLTDINIYDYFPQEIVDNFDFTIVKEPTMGTVSDSINLQNNDILWHIDRLSYGESAELSYKLTLKENINSDIVDVVLKTNKRVDITTEKLRNEDDTLEVFTSDVSSKIKLVKPEPAKDETTSPTPIPQAGVLITVYIVLGLAVVSASAFGIRAFIMSKKVK